jgi:hypothetical protein
MQTFFATSALILAAGLAAASSASSSLLSHGAHAEPSNFDYLVLASIADSPHLTAMASYRPSRMQPDASGVLVRSASKHQ